MGAVLLGCADLRIGADIEAKVGLNELAIGLPMTRFAAEIMRARLDTRRFHEAVTLARIYSPREAVDVGYLDRLVGADDVVDEAITAGKELADYLDATAFRITRKTVQGGLIKQLHSFQG
jgi:enoyl-CoA hydratase